MNRTLQGAVVTFVCALGAATVQFGRVGLAAALAAGAVFAAAVTSQAAAMARAAQRPPVDTARQALTLALRRERDSYRAAGNAERADQVQAEIDRLERRPTDGAT